ncbi:MAG: HAMP domain-containing sensor histidine kinase [Nitriliruptorales bacterium]|nr:HAMP domain-containing sensor histidine kinase [Nitriliruptorales bacterium]
MNDVRAGDTHACEEIISNLRHELLTPLSVINLVFEDLSNNADALSGDARELLSTGRRQLAVARALVDDLHLAGDEELQLSLEVVDLREVVREHVQDLDRTFIRERDIRSHETDEPVRVEVDRHRIGQVLRNLLDNADKYSPPNEPIEVHVTSGEQGAEVWVVDSGDGVAPENTERIFERYIRGDDTESGLGLGLAISRRIARAHGGELTVTDAPDDRGSRFVLELPLV